MLANGLISVASIPLERQAYNKSSRVLKHLANLKLGATCRAHVEAEKMDGTST